MILWLKLLNRKAFRPIIQFKSNRIRLFKDLYFNFRTVHVHFYKHDNLIFIITVCFKNGANAE